MICLNESSPLFLIKISHQVANDYLTAYSKATRPIVCCLISQDTYKCLPVIPQMWLEDLKDCLCLRYRSRYSGSIRMTVLRSQNFQSYPPFKLDRIENKRLATGRDFLKKTSLLFELSRYNKYQGRISLDQICTRRSNHSQHQVLVPCTMVQFFSECLKMISKLVLVRPTPTVE